MWIVTSEKVMTYFSRVWKLSRYIYMCLTPLVLWTKTILKIHVKLKVFAISDPKLVLFLVTCIILQRMGVTVAILIFI